MLTRIRWSLAELQLLLRVWESALEEALTAAQCTPEYPPLGVSARVTERFLEQSLQLDGGGPRVPRSYKAIGHMKKLTLSLAQFITGYSTMITAARKAHTSASVPQFTLSDTESKEEEFGSDRHRGLPATESTDGDNDASAREWFALSKAERARLYKSNEPKRQYFDIDASTYAQVRNIERLQAQLQKELNANEDVATAGAIKSESGVDLPIKLVARDVAVVAPSTASQRWKEPDIRRLLLAWRDAIEECRASEDGFVSDASELNARIHRCFEELPGWKASFKRSKAALICKKEAVVEMCRIITDFNSRVNAAKAGNVRGGGTVGKRDWFSLSQEEQRAHMKESSEKEITYVKITLFMYQKIRKLVQGEADILNGRLGVFVSDPSLPRTPSQELLDLSAAPDSEADCIAFSGVDISVAEEPSPESEDESDGINESDDFESTVGCESDDQTSQLKSTKEVASIEASWARIADLLEKQARDSRKMLQEAREERRLDREERERDRIEARRDRRDRAREREERRLEREERRKDREERELDREERRKDRLERKRERLEREQSSKKKLKTN